MRPPWLDLQGNESLSELSAVEPKSRATRKKGAARRQQIVDIARQILIEAGEGGLVLRDVAEKAGITHGNLQYYFATKDDLIVAVFDQEVLRYTRSMHDAVNQTSTKEGTISAIIDSALTEMRSESTTLWMMLSSLARQSEALRGILKTANDRYDQSLAEVLGRIDVALSEQRRGHLAQMIRMMIDGLGVQSAYVDLSSAEVIALQSEMKVAISAWFNVDQATPSVG